MSGARLVGGELEQFWVRNAEGSGDFCLTVICKFGPCFAGEGQNHFFFLGCKKSKPVDVRPTAI